MVFHLSMWHVFALSTLLQQRFACHSSHKLHSSDILEFFSSHYIDAVHVFIQFIKTLIDCTIFTLLVLVLTALGEWNFWIIKQHLKKKNGCDPNCRDCVTDVINDILWNPIK